MLVRDAPELEVFMLRRTLAAEFMGGAYVFPGGAVDAGDRAPELLARCHGGDASAASTQLGLHAGGIGFWVAAIREAFEEAGVLLARSAATGEPVDLDEPGAAARMETARREVGRGERPFLEVVEAEDLLLDTGSLHLFSHWITPPGAPRRYDTWFFVAAAPDGHAYVHDAGERGASVGIRPADALAGAEQGELEIIFPTMRNLEQLARFATSRVLLEAVTASEPRVVADAGGARIMLPGDPGYEGVA